MLSDNLFRIYLVYSMCILDTPPRKCTIRVVGVNLVPCHTHFHNMSRQNPDRALQQLLLLYLRRLTFAANPQRLLMEPKQAPPWEHPHIDPPVSFLELRDALISVAPGILGF